MQQDKRRRVFGAGLSVKDGEPIYLCCAIKSRVSPCITEPLLPLHLETDIQLDTGVPSERACPVIGDFAHADRRRDPSIRCLTDQWPLPG
jgi:hypothetical protein